MTVTIMATVFLCKKCDEVQWYELPYCLKCHRHDFFILDVEQDEWGKLSLEEIKKRVES